MQRFDRTVVDRGPSLRRWASFLREHQQHDRTTYLCAGNHHAGNHDAGHAPAANRALRDLGSGGLPRGPQPPRRPR
jgi:hypothetical protein